VGTGKGVIVKLKEYECVQVNHHRDVGGIIMEWQKKGWRLCTYQATGLVQILSITCCLRKATKQEKRPNIKDVVIIAEAVEAEKERQKHRR